MCNIFMNTIMKIHHPTSDDLRKMDDLLDDIKDKTFQMRICICDKHEVELKESLLLDQLKEKNLIIEQLENLVRRWSYVPLCAACYLSKIAITSYGDEPTELEKMDDLILRFQLECFHLRKYKRNTKRDARSIHLMEDTAKTKLKLLGRLQDLTKTWDYVPMCAADLLEQLE